MTYLWLGEILSEGHFFHKKTFYTKIEGFTLWKKTSSRGRNANPTTT